MKVIAFYPGIYPEGFAPMSYRLHYYMKALQISGVEVEVVTPAESEIRSGIYDNIPYRFVKVTPRNRLNGRQINKEYVLICGELAKKCDVVFTTNEGNLYLKKIADAVHAVGGKLALEINENPYSIIASRLNTKLSLSIKRLYFLKRILKKVDGIIVISQPLFDLISSNKNINAAVVRIPILTGDKFKKIEIEKGGIPYILHAGALSEQKDGVKAMLEAFAIAHKKLDGNLKFIFTNRSGFPSLLRWIEQFTRKNKLEKFVEFKGLVPLNELDELYNKCAMAIINKPSNAQNDFNFPTKLTELLPRGIPVIVSSTGELKNFFVDNQNAFVVGADNAEQIADKILYIQSHPEEVSIVTRNGKLLAEKEFYYLNHADKLLDFFTKLIKI